MIVTPLLLVLVDILVQNIKTYHGDNLISIYGIGSYFDDHLPATWDRTDVDIIVIVKSIESIPKEAWNNRFESRSIEGYQVYIGYNSITMYQNKEVFQKSSFSNYKWSLMNVKYKENFTLLFGEDIQDKLPDPKNIKFDFDDILRRSLYHLEMGLKEKDNKAAMSRFSKAVFKFGYYLCIFFDEDFLFTSIVKIKKKLESIVSIVKHVEKVLEFFKEAIAFRTKGIFTRDFSQLRKSFIAFIFSLLEHGGLHKRFTIPELNLYLGNSFSGFPLLKRFLKGVDQA